MRILVGDFRALLYLTLLFPAAASSGADWPQLQHDAARTAHTAEAVPPPFRARWIWMGADRVLRNRESGQGEKWKNDLKSRPGYNYPMPEKVAFTFAGSMQPIAVGGRVFVADVQGKVYALSLDDGSTLWTADNPGGSFWPGVATDKIVVFPSLLGYLTAYDANTGARLWQFDTGKSITSAPALAGDVIYAASQSGRVYAIGLDGKKKWESEYLGAPIQGGLCVHNGKVFTGTEAMDAMALDAASGKVVARRKLMGQSFRLVWPVGVKDRVIFTAVPVVCVGSEYVNDGLIAGKKNGSPWQNVGWNPKITPGYPDVKAEQEAFRKWLASDDGKFWETHFALRADDLQKDYIVATGATEGCGTPPDPPAIDANGRPLLWWASGYGTIIKKCGFGTNFTTDISALDLDSGDRVLIDNGRYASQSTETDNLYAMSVGGRFLYLRQNFRGTSAIDLTTSEHWRISAVYRTQDGGGWQSPVNYADNPQGGARAPSPPGGAAAGRVPPIIADGKLVFTESFAVTCVETAR